MQLQNDQEQLKRIIHFLYQRQKPEILPLLPPSLHKQSRSHPHFYRIKDHRNFFHQIILIESISNQSISSFQNQISKQFRNDQIYIDFDSIVFINRTDVSLKLQLGMQSYINKNIIDPTTPLSAIFDEFDPVVSIIIQMCPKRLCINADIQYLKDHSLIKQKNILDNFKVNIADYLDNVLIHQTDVVFQYLEANFLEGAVYLNFKGTYEDFSQGVMEKGNTMKSIEEIRMSDELWQMLFFKNFHFQIMNLKIDMYRPIVIKIKVRVPDDVGKCIRLVGNQVEQNMMDFLDHAFPTRNEEIKKILAIKDIIFKGQ